MEVVVKNEKQMIPSFKLLLYGEQKALKVMTAPATEIIV